VSRSTARQRLVANDEILVTTYPAIAEFSNLGAVLSGSGFTGGGLSSPEGIAIDSSGNAWVADYAGLVVELNNSGTILSGQVASHLAA